MAETCTNARLKSIAGNHLSDQTAWSLKRLVGQKTFSYRDPQAASLKKWRLPAWVFRSLFRKTPTCHSVINQRGALARLTSGLPEWASTFQRRLG